MLSLSDAIARESVILELAAEKKTDAMAELVDRAASILGLGETDSIIRSLNDREAMVSTGIGDGVAIPHARVEAIDKTVVIIARKRQGLDFDALDGKAVRLFFLILSPMHAEHAQLMFLSALARIVRKPETRTALIDAASADEIVGIMRTVERI